MSEQNEQVVDLVRKYGVKRAYETCKARAIMGRQCDEQLFVDVKPAEPASRTREVEEDGVKYYVFVNLSHKRKQELLNALSADLAVLDN